MLGGILVALQKHYAAFLKRVETIAAMLDKVKAVSLFAAEIPSSMPLQWHFYQTIQSPDWLPLLLDRQLVREPLVDEESEVTDYGPWPIGHYLLSVAKAGDAKGIPHLAKALRTIQGSSHPAVKRSGLEVIAALPAEDANDLVDIVTRWLRQDTPNFYYTAADVILKRLADNGYTESALKVAASLFRVFEHGGEVASIHPIHMYEHLLPGAVKTLVSIEGCLGYRPPSFGACFRRGPHFQQSAGRRLLVSYAAPARRFPNGAIWHLGSSHHCIA